MLVIITLFLTYEGGDDKGQDSFVTRFARGIDGKDFSRKKGQSCCRIQGVSIQQVNPSSTLILANDRLVSSCLQHRFLSRFGDRIPIRRGFETYRTA